MSDEQAHEEADQVFAVFVAAIEGRSLEAVVNASMSILSGSLAEICEGDTGTLDCMVDKIGPALKETARRSLESWRTGKAPDVVVTTVPAPVAYVSADDDSPQALLHREVQDALRGQPLDHAINSAATVLTGCFAQIASCSGVDIDQQIDHLAAQLKSSVRHALTQTKGMRQ